MRERAHRLQFGSGIESHPHFVWFVYFVVTIRVFPPSPIASSQQASHLIPWCSLAHYGSPNGRASPPPPCPNSVTHALGSRPYSIHATRASRLQKTDPNPNGTRLDLHGSANSTSASKLAAYSSHQSSFRSLLALHTLVSGLGKATRWSHNGSTIVTNKRRPGRIQARSTVKPPSRRINWPPARGCLAGEKLKLPTIAADQGHHEQDQENNKANLGDRRGSSGDNTKAEDTGDKSNEEEDDSVA